MFLKLHCRTDMDGRKNTGGKLGPDFKFMATKAFRNGKITSPKEMAGNYLTSQGAEIPGEVMRIINSSSSPSYLKQFIVEMKKGYENK